MKDTMITLKMADLLNIKDSAIVIPTNTTFDTTMDNCFISDKSIQGQFQKRMYGTDFSELNVALKNSLEECYPDHFEILTDRIRTNEKRYDIGTVAKVTRQNQHYYFLAVADVSKSGKNENVTMANMTKALVGLWEYLTKEGHTEPITIPVSLITFLELFQVNTKQASKVTLFESFFVVYDKLGLKKPITNKIYNDVLNSPLYISYARQGTVKMKNMNERWKAVYEIWNGSDNGDNK